MSKVTIAFTGQGGDCPGLNQFFYTTFSIAKRHGWKIIGCYGGLDSLIDGTWKELKYEDIQPFKDSGGLFLGSPEREEGLTSLNSENPLKPIMAKERLDKIKIKANELGIDCIIGSGGSGGQTSFYYISEYLEIPFITVPKSIDNNLNESQNAIGFKNSMNVGVDFSDNIGDTSATNKNVHFINTMGDGAGWLALSIAIAKQAAACIISERSYNINMLFEHIQNKTKNKHRTDIIIFVEEKVKKLEEDINNPKYNNMSPAKYLAAKISEMGIKSRSSNPQYVFRGGKPIASERLWARFLAQEVINCLQEDDLNVMISIEGNLLSTNIERVKLSEMPGYQNKQVPNDHPLIYLAEDMDMYIGMDS